MLDQASELRQLVMHAAVDDAPPGDGAPRLVALAGGKGGVGTTTVATNIAAALARQGQRVVLVDADLQRGDVAAATEASIDRFARRLSLQVHGPEVL